MVVTATVLNLLVSSCTNSNIKNNDCTKFDNEFYSSEDLSQYDFTMIEMLNQDLSKFGAYSIKGNKTESYQLMYCSSFKKGKLIRIESSNKGATISVKCLENKEAGYYCTEGDIKIDSSQWITFQSMIYEFNYWTENQVEINNGYFDGYSYILEGNRPQAEKCGKKNYNVIIRANPEHDKIAALCEEIITFEEVRRLEKELN